MAIASYCIMFSRVSLSAILDILMLLICSPSCLINSFSFLLSLVIVCFFI